MFLADWATKVARRCAQRRHSFLVPSKKPDRVIGSYIYKQIKESACSEGMNQKLVNDPNFSGEATNLGFLFLSISEKRFCYRIWQCCFHLFFSCFISLSTARPSFYSFWGHTSRLYESCLLGEELEGCHKVSPEEYTLKTAVSCPMDKDQTNYWICYWSTTIPGIALEVQTRIFHQKCSNTNQSP